MRKKRNILFTAMCIVAASQAELADYMNTVGSPADGGSGPALWYPTSRDINSGSAGTSYVLTSDGAMTNPSTDFWGNPDSAFGITERSTKGAAVAGSTGLFTSGETGTVCFLFKTPSFFDGFKSLFNQGAFGAASQFEVGINGNILRLGNQNGTLQPAINLGKLSGDTWYFFAMTWDIKSRSWGNLSWYYGEAGSETLNTGVATMTSAGNKEPVYFGGRASGYIFKDGFFHNIAIYERVLSKESIQAQFNAL